MSSEQFRCGYAAIIGKPNVGKSTLLNAMIGSKLSIVSAKPQTTRKKIIGLYTDEAHQIIFVDTPGIISPRYLLQQSMMDSVHQALRECDLSLIVLDVSRASSPTSTIPEEIRNILPMLHHPVILVLNKTDLIHDKKTMLPIIESLAKAHPFKAIIPVSALKKDSIDILRKEIFSSLPEHPPLYAADDLSEHPVRFFVSEIIREKIFDAYHEEIPYSTTVEIIEFNERDAAKDFIAADIVVERESQKRILIGEGGNALKHVGMKARKEIEMLVGREVFLELRVKVREGWRDNPAMLKNFGYELN